MTTRSALRDRIRSELGDTVVTYLWSDAQLNEWINAALEDWSQVVPPVVTTAQTTIAGTKTYTLANRHQGIMAVFANAVAPGNMVYDALWTVVNIGSVQNIEFVFDPGGTTYYIRYLGFYTALSTDGSVLDCSVSSEQALIYWVCWHASNWLGAQREKRGVKPATAERDYQKLYNAERKSLQKAKTWRINPYE